MLCVSLSQEHTEAFIHLLHPAPPQASWGQVMSLQFSSVDLGFYSRSLPHCASRPSTQFFQAWIWSRYMTSFLCTYWKLNCPQRQTQSNRNPHAQST